jgi:hypothetical protein
MSDAECQSDGQQQDGYVPENVLPIETAVSCPFSHHLPNFELARSLNRAENEYFYLTHWDNSCLGALDYFFQNITLLSNHYQPLKHSILALSACNFSRICPEKDVSSTTRISQYRPHRHHQTASQYYYTSALGQVANILSKASSPCPSDTLAILVVFCYIESTMGTFLGFGCHADGIMTFIRAQSNVISTNIGHPLISSYVLARHQSWWRRMNFSSFNFQRQQPSLSLSGDVAAIVHSIDAKRTMVTAIMCESSRISTVALLQLWEDQDRLHNTRHNTADKYIAMLECESRKLDDWELMLSPSDFPNASLSFIDTAINDNVQPLFFKSHYDAMNYAYYIVARIMQCTWHFTRLQHTTMNQACLNTDEERITSWMNLLIRVVAGLDKKQCAKRNVYSIGVSSLLMACITRCYDPRIGQWIEKWLRELLGLSVLEEGSFPVTQALALAILVNKERSIGNEIYAIGLPQDDGGGCGKYSSYFSQNIDRIVIKWRERGSNRHYSRHVSLWDNE